MPTFSMPLHLKSKTNARGHWSGRHRVSKAERKATREQLEYVVRTRPEPPVTVLLVRVAPRELDDDNATECFKSIRDEIAAWFGVDDADPRITWKYGQRKGPAKTYAAEVTITSDAE